MASHSLRLDQSSPPCRPCCFTLSRGDSSSVTTAANTVVQPICPPRQSIRILRSYFSGNQSAADQFTQMIQTVSRLRRSVSSLDGGEGSSSAIRIFIVIVSAAPQERCEVLAQVPAPDNLEALQCSETGPRILFPLSHRKSEPFGRAPGLQLLPRRAVSFPCHR